MSADPKMRSDNSDFAENLYMSVTLASTNVAEQESVLAIESTPRCAKNEELL